MCSTQQTAVCVAVTALALTVGCGRTEPLTPEASRAKGEAMLRQMSQSIGAAQVFSYVTDQTLERVRSTGERETHTFSRSIIVRRPNQLAFTDKGKDHETAAWYDGKHLTIVSNKEKIWVRGPMPASLDEAMDFLAAEYDVKLPTADLLYSNPYEALMTPDTTGGWVNVERVGERSCEHLSYQHAIVDWQIWLNSDERRLPCQIQITYKTDPGQPVTRIVFRDWNEAPGVSESTFAPVVPEGYRRIKIMRHATVEDESAANDKGGAQ